MSRAVTTEQKCREAIFKLEMEKQLRCGDGSGNQFIITHSINCRCKEIDADIERVRKQLLSL